MLYLFVEKLPIGQLTLQVTYHHHFAREVAEVAEEVLIDHHRPRLNILGNSFGRALPET
jgi:hypothetical protein